jgi:hypothetical protein
MNGLLRKRRGDFVEQRGHLVALLLAVEPDPVHLVVGLHSLPGVRLVTLHTGCQQLVFRAQNNVKSANPGCQTGYVDHTGCHLGVLAAK